MKHLSFLLVALLAIAACDTPVQAPLDGPHVGLYEADNTLTGDAQFGTSTVFPSTNEANYAMSPTKWAHVLWVETPEVIPGQVTLEFVSERTFWSCFEYRVDDEGPQSLDNPNDDVTDGRWGYTCQNNSSAQMTFHGNEYVDVRMAFGGERDERFDWTRFYILSLENKDQCQDGEWQAWGFKNQGQCVRYVETGKDSR
jgi:hypothetical protein